MPGLLALDLIDVGDGVAEAAVGIAFDAGLFAALAPEVAVADVVIVWDADGGAVADDVAELEAELDPAGGVLGVAVGLITAEEEDIGVLSAEVVDDFGAGADGSAGVATHVGDDDDVFVHGIAADEAFELGGLAVADAIGDVFGAVPAFDAEVGVPAWVEDIGAGDFLPVLAIWADFEAGDAFFIWFEGEELGAHFEHAVLLGVVGEADDLIAWDIHGGCGGGAAFGFALGFGLGLGFAIGGGGGCGGAALGPPLAGGEGFELREIGAEGLGGVGGGTGAADEKQWGGLKEVAASEVHLNSEWGFEI